MRLVFFGSGFFALECLRALLAAGFAPVLVVTQPPRRRRRRGGDEPTPVQQAAGERRLDVLAPESANADEALQRLRGAAADLFVVAEYGQILRQALLDIPPLGTINVHGSLLPRHRGATPVAAALLAGDGETGVCVQRVVRRLDAGPVLAERRVTIGAEEDCGDLTARLARLGGAVLVEVVTALAEGRPPEEREQDEAAATYCRKLTAEDASIEWDQSAEDLARFVRAMTPRPGARATLRREPPLPLQIRRARPGPGAAEPGVVAAVDADGFAVGTSDGLLRVLELVPAGRRAMSARDFVNGYRLRPGESLR